MKWTLLLTILLSITAVAGATPSTPTCQINPSSPLDTDSLTLQCSATDSDADFLTYDWSWTRDSTPISSGPYIESGYIHNPVYDTGIRRSPAGSYPTVFSSTSGWLTPKTWYDQENDQKHMITGSYNGPFIGLTYTGTQWVSNASIITGLDEPTGYSDIEIFYDDGQYRAITFTYAFPSAWTENATWYWNQTTKNWVHDGNKYLCGLNSTWWGDNPGDVITFRRLGTLYAIVGHEADGTAGLEWNPGTECWESASTNTANTGHTIGILNGIPYEFIIRGNDLDTWNNGTHLRIKENIYEWNGTAYNLNNTLKGPNRPLHVDRQDSRIGYTIIISGSNNNWYRGQSWIDSVTKGFPSGQTITIQNATILSSQTTAEETWEATIRSYDGTSYSPTTTISTTIISSCTPNWNCTGYEACIEPAENASCNAVEDLNSCGDTYNGDYTEFEPTTCEYEPTPTGGGGGGSWPEPEEQTGNTTEPPPLAVIPPEEEELEPTIQFQELYEELRILLQRIYERTITRQDVEETATNYTLELLITTAALTGLIIAGTRGLNKRPKRKKR